MPFKSAIAGQNRFKEVVLMLVKMPWNVLNNFLLLVAVTQGNTDFFCSLPVWGFTRRGVRRLLPGVPKMLLNTRFPKISPAASWLEASLEAQSSCEKQRNRLHGVSEQSQLCCNRDGSFRSQTHAICAWRV